MSEWQPIETFRPTTSVDFLLSNGFHVFVGWFSFDDGCWYDSTHSDERFGLEPQFPTHWMPLPAPPGKDKP